MTHFRVICNSNVRLKHINIIYRQRSRYWKFSLEYFNAGFFIKKNGRIFKFSISVCIWNNNPLSIYYASPETLAFINLFNAIRGDVYCNILKEICSVFVHDYPKYLFWRTNAVCFTTLLFQGKFQRYLTRRNVQGNILNPAMWKKIIKYTCTFKNTIFQFYFLVPQILRTPS